MQLAKMLIAFFY